MLARGRPGEVYNIGGASEQRNIEVVEGVCTLLDELKPRAQGRYRSMITFVKHRPGHDRRYAMNTAKIRAELEWVPEQTFHSGLRRTVEWYLANRTWVKGVASGEYRRWVEINYAVR